jgi:hypothetical protein
MARIADVAAKARALTAALPANRDYFTALAAHGAPPAAQRDHAVP